MKPKTYRAGTPAYAAVETRYNGIKYRSRLEARWSLFFDLLSIQHSYEPEKFQVGEDRYIPDFYLPKHGYDDDGMYLEIKGPEPTDEEIRKVVAVSRITNKEFLICSGNIGDHRIVSAWNIQDEETEKLPMAWQQCLLCGAISIGAARRNMEHTCVRVYDVAEKYNIDSCFPDFHDGLTGPVYSPDTPMLAVAYEAARSARFESPEFAESLDLWHRFMQILRAGKVFGGANGFMDLYSFAHDLSLEPKCPRFEGRRTA